MLLRWRIATLAALTIIGTTALAQTPMRVRGTIVAIDGPMLMVKTREGRDLKLELASDLSISVAKAIRLADVKAGDYVGATTMTRGDGPPVAVEVHYLPPTVPEGQGPWDLQPGSTMTNANVDSVVIGTGNHELTLRFKGTTQKIMVPDDVPIVRAVPGVRGDLVPGEYIFTVPQAGADGKLTASRIQVSKDGVKPPQ